MHRSVRLFSNDVKQSEQRPDRLEISLEEPDRFCYDRPTSHERLCQLVELTFDNRMVRILYIGERYQRPSVNENRVSHVQICQNDAD